MSHPHKDARKDNTRERLKVDNITEKCRKVGLRWFGYVKRRDQDKVGRQTLHGDGWYRLGEEGEEDRNRDG